jgi:hypothetical protein
MCVFPQRQGKYRARRSWFPLNCSSDRKPVGKCKNCWLVPISIFFGGFFVISDLGMAKDAHLTGFRYNTVCSCP